MMPTNLYSSINQQAIILAVQAVQREDVKMMTQLGIHELDAETYAALKSLNINDLNHVHDFRGSLLHVRVDYTQLRRFLTMATEKSREDDQINRAIRAGIRQPTLEELKGITRREFSARRTQLGMPENTKGRIENLSEEDELSVLRCWAKTKDIEDPLERLLVLYGETQIALDRAWAAIKQSS